MKQLISEQSSLYLQVMLTDAKISEKLLENANEGEKYKWYTVMPNGNVVLGKAFYLSRGFSKFWCRLLNCQDEIPFESLCLKIWDALVDLSSGINNEAILEGLSREIIISTVREKKYDYIIHRLHYCWANVAQGSAGYQKVVPSAESLGKSGLRDDNDYQQIHLNQVGQREIVINVNGIKKTIPFIDSVGDPLNVGLDIGIVGVRKIN